MKIERIELENWMSYPRRWITFNEQGESTETVPTIDFSTQPLTLVSGENGSGKSAILEAVCYALFAKYPRSKKNQDAIRNGKEKARVKLYFVLPAPSGDVKYCIKRLLTKSAGGTNATLEKINDDGPPEVLVTGQSAVTRYVEEQLLYGVKYDAFVSTIFLRQQKAGEFMERPHSDQREQLLHLCRLDVYEQIHKKAHEHRKSLDGRVKDLQQQFDKVNYATEEHLTKRSNDAKQLKQALVELRGQEISAKQVLENIQRVATLEQEIGELEQQLEEWTRILEHAEEIRHAHQWTITWERIRNTLNRAKKIHTTLSSRATKIQQVEQEFKTAKTKAEELAGEHNKLESQYQRQEQALNQVRDALPMLIERRNTARRKLEDARKANELDEVILRTQEEQVKRKDQLFNFDEVQRKRDYAQLLGQGQTALEYVLDRLKEAETLQQAAEQQAAESQTAEQDAALLGESRSHKQTDLVEYEQKREHLIEQQNELGRLRDRSQDIITNRNQAIANDVCPTCGTEMVGDVGEKVYEEIQEHKAQIELVDNRIGVIAQELAIVEPAIDTLGKEIAFQKGQVIDLEHQAKHAREVATSSQEKSQKSHQQANERWQQYLATWGTVSPPERIISPVPEVQKIIQDELDELEGIEEEHLELTKTQAKYESEENVLQERQAERANLDVIYPVLKAFIVSLESDFSEASEVARKQETERKKLDSKTKHLKNKLQLAKKKSRGAEQEQTTLDRNLNSLKSEQDTDRKHLTGMRETVQAEQQQIGSQFPDMASVLLQAIESSDSYNDLKMLADRHKEMSNQLDKLQNAETESGKVRTERELKQRELDGLSQRIAEVSEAEALQELGRIQAELLSKEPEFHRVLEEIGTIKGDHQRRQDLTSELKGVKSNLWAYREIEQAIYPGTKTKAAGPLFAHVTQRLMESISQEASQLLNSLGWHMDIGYNKKTGFCITDRTLDATRKYVEFSGGERFAIAIAVALAIGRVTHGAGNIRCLFIDEGFGALDSKHRRTIIDDAIGKLIEIGSREQVVVITHLKDMQGYFPHRIELKRERETDHSILGPVEEEALE